MTYPLASGALAGTFTPAVDLFVGPCDDLATGASPSLVASVAKQEVVALTDTGITTFVTGTHVGAQAVIAAVAVDAIGKSVPYYSGGSFNHAALTWPTALDTLVKRKKFFQGTAIHIGGLVAGGTSAS